MYIQMIVLYGILTTRIKILNSDLIETDKRWNHIDYGWLCEGQCPEVDWYEHRHVHLVRFERFRRLAFNLTLE